jgi:hypothetical protein
MTAAAEREKMFNPSIVVRRLPAPQTHLNKGLSHGH